MVIELMGGYTHARRFVLRAIKNGKSVVTANKALLAVHGPEIFERAEKAGVDIGFEASVGGGIPIIRTLREGGRGRSQPGYLRHRQRDIELHPQHDDAARWVSSLPCSVRRSTRGWRKRTRRSMSTASMRRTS